MKGKINLKAISLLAAMLGLFLLAYAPKSQSHPQPASLPLSAPAFKAGDSLDTETGLILAPGFSLVKSNCIRCHSAQLITTKRASREGWEGTIRWMQSTQGLGDLGKDEAVILDYLAKNYALTKQGRRPPLQNITWYPLHKSKP